MNMKKEAQLKVENCGSQLCIWIEGEEEAVNQRFYSFWNHGATSGELHWELDWLAYFWTTPDKLKKALVNINLFKVLNDAEANGYLDQFKGEKGGALPYARKMAEQQYEELLTEKTMRNMWRYQTNTNYAEIMEVSAERPDESNVHTDWNTSHTTLISRLKSA
jgi:hypothetical protein